MLILQKLPFLLEFFFNGTFCLLFALKISNRLPLWMQDDVVYATLDGASALLPIIVFLHVTINYLNSHGIADFLRRYSFSVFIFVAMYIVWTDTEFVFWLATAHLISSILTLYDAQEGEAIERHNDVQKRDKVDFIGNAAKLPFIIRPIGYAMAAVFAVMNYAVTAINVFLNGCNAVFSFLFASLTPARIIIFSFLGTILVGAGGLCLPFSATSGDSIGFIDALFISTSAVCVTGLSTINVAADLSTFGKVILIVLVQIGGLGIMTLSAAITMILGKRMAMKTSVMLQEAIDISSIDDVRNMILDIVKYTFLIEFWGAVFLAIAFCFEGLDLSTAMCYGIFHSISAFCNAGFALFDNNLENFTTNPFIYVPIASLIVLGGIGFIVLREIRNMIFIKEKRSLVRMSFHSKIVLSLTAVLIVTGALFIFFGEYLHALDGYSFWEQVGIAVFQSITLRTAGFSTIPFSGLQSYTLYIMCIYMFIGASPGGTGGGIKTTTTAILFSSIRATLFGEKRVHVFNRNFSNQVVVKATALAVLSLSFVLFIIFLLMQFEPDHRFLALVFEAFSALGTVGVSVGITPFLTTAGKLLICVLMYAGRTGPLTLALAIGEKRKQSGQYEYPDGRVLIG